VVKTKEAPPTFSGTVRIAVFTDVAIATGDKKDAPASTVDMAKVESAVKRVKGVTSFAFDAASREISVGYSGPAPDAKNIKIAIDGQALASELLSPAKIVIRPMGKIEKPEAALAAVKGVAGVVASEMEYNDLVAYGDLSTLSLDSLEKAVEGSGAKCQIVSHEEIKIKYSGTGSIDELKKDLEHTKWVLKVDIADSTVKVLSAKGRLTRALVKSVMSKHGFPEAQ
jgi:hypothetical protein